MVFELLYITEENHLQKKNLDEKEKGLNEALNHIQFLKRELAGKDVEVGYLLRDYSLMSLG